MRCVPRSSGSVSASAGIAAMVASLAASGCGSSSKGQADGGTGPQGLCALGEQERVLPAEISSQVTLSAACSPYFLKGPLTVRAPLIIEAGVRVLTCASGCDSRITVLGPKARLSALGREGEPVVFTPMVPGGAPKPGEWTGLLLRNGADGSTLDHVVIEYAGGPTRGNPELGDDQMVTAGLVVWDTQSVSVRDSVFRGNRGYGMRVKTADDKNDESVFDDMKDNTFVGNTEAALRWPVNQLGSIDGGNCFAGRNDDGSCATPVDARSEGALVEGDAGDSRGQFVVSDQTWRSLGVPYFLVDGAVVHGATLRIADPNELWMGVGSLTVGLDAAGTLKAEAAAPRGIRFLSGQANPAPGDWDGILFEEKAGSSSVLANVEVAHAGRSAWRAAEGKAAIWIYNAAPTVKNAYVHDTLGGAVHWNCASGAVVESPTWDAVQCKPEAKQNWGCPCSPFMMCKPACM